MVPTAKKVTRVRKELSTRRRPTTWPMPLLPTSPSGRAAVRTRTKTVTLYNRYDSLKPDTQVEEPSQIMTLASSSTTRWTSQLLGYQAHQLKMRYKRKSQLRGKLMRQIRKQTIHLRMKDQGSEMKASTLATGLGRGWRRTNHLATGVRDDRPVRTVNDYRKDANLKERPSAQLTLVLTPMPKKEGKTKGHVNKGCHTKPMRHKTRHIDVRLDGRPRNAQAPTHHTLQASPILPRTLREYQISPLWLSPQKRLISLLAVFFLPKKTN